MDPTRLFATKTKKPKVLLLDHGLPLTAAPARFKKMGKLEKRCTFDLLHIHGLFLAVASLYTCRSTHR